MSVVKEHYKGKKQRFKCFLFFVLPNKDFNIKKPTTNNDYHHSIKGTFQYAKQQKSWRDHLYVKARMTNLQNHFHFGLVHILETTNFQDINTFLPKQVHDASVPAYSPHFPIYARRSDSTIYCSRLENALSCLYTLMGTPSSS